LFGSLTERPTKATFGCSSEASSTQRPSRLARFPIIGEEEGAQQGNSTDHSGNFYVEFDSYLALALERARFAGERQFNPIPYRTSNCVLSQFTHEAVDVLLERYNALVNSKRACFLFKFFFFFQKSVAPAPNRACVYLGFALPGRRASEDVAFPFSESRYVAELDCSLLSDASFNAAVQLSRDWTAAFESKGLCAGAFLNFPFRNLTNYPSKYWAGNAARLSQVRRVFNPDPENVLKFEQQVPLLMD
jgi:hypothetical protein